MAQNTSTAVMQRRVEPHDSLDYFPTPPWATRALCEHVLRASKVGSPTVWEPACGEGHMARPLGEYFAAVYASDIHPYGFGNVVDFLWPSDGTADWVITNPPFRLAQQFVETGLKRACRGVAVFVRTAWLEGQDRYRDLFSKHPPAVVAQFTERVCLLKGRLVRLGDIDPQTGEPAATATSYCWIVFEKLPAPQTKFLWIPPCRKALERDGDYA